MLGQMWSCLLTTVASQDCDESDRIKKIFLTDMKTSGTE
jgi:hypothetical protein